MDNRFKQAFENIPASSEFVLETVNDSDILGDTSAFSFEEQLNAASQPTQQSQPFNEQSQQQTSLNIGDMVTGAFVVNAIDNILPPITVAGFKMADININKKDLQLTADEKRFLEPPVDDYLKTVNIRLSPLEAMLLAFGTVYAGKAATIYANVSTGSNKTRNNDLNSTNEGAIKKPRKQRSDAGTKKKI